MKLVQYMTKDYGRGNDFGLFILRIVAALVLFYGHGMEKFSTITGGGEIQFLDPIGIGATTSFYMASFAEIICAVLLIIGLFSRWAAAVLTLNFIVINIFHAFIAKDGFPVLELRFLYLASFFALFLLGPGRISLDYLIFGSKKR